MKHSKTGLFLMELIVGILFFALAGALCVQLFVKANTMNEESICKDQGMRIAVNIVEVYKNDKTNDLVNEEIVYFDDFGQAVDKKDATYEADIKKNGDEITVQVVHDEEVIYTLDYYNYQQRKWQIER